MFVKVFFSFDYSDIGVLGLNSGGCKVVTFEQFKIIIHHCSPRDSSLLTNR